MPELENRPVTRIQNLIKHFRRNDGTTVRAVDGVSLDISRGEFLVLLGPSGCGKTTLLRTVAGLESATSGQIDIRNQQVFSSERKVNLPPERRMLSMIFQSYALWPHMSVFDNIAYPLRRGAVAKLSKAQIAKRVYRAMEQVSIGELGRQYPSHLSGGQQQRVALARAVVAESDLVLFDEPLSNVDAKVREQLRIELLAMQDRLGFSALYVTHDQSEAMGLGDRIAVMREGRVAQLGTPQNIYDQPTSRYVAKFVGTSNEIVGKLTAMFSDGTGTVETAIGATVGYCGVEGLAVGDEVAAVWRPETTVLDMNRSPMVTNSWPGEVEASLFLGPYREHIVRIGDLRVRTRDAKQLLTRGDHPLVLVDPSHIRILPLDDDHTHRPTP